MLEQTKGIILRYIIIINIAILSCTLPIYGEETYDKCWDLYLLQLNYCDKLESGTVGIDACVAFAQAEFALCRLLGWG